MPGRTYNQLCPIALALDLLGARWSWLLIRELSYGPRRFSDLHRGVPGMGKNLLSRRLKDLEQAGVLRRRRLPPPAAAAVYELTPQGESLKSILGDLTRWGLQLLPAARIDESHLGVIATMNTLEALFNPQAAAYLALTVECRLDEDVFFLQIRRGTLIIEQGPASAPDLILAGDPKTLLLLAAGGLHPGNALEGGLVRILQGNRSFLLEFTSLFNAFPDRLP